MSAATESQRRRRSSEQMLLLEAGARFNFEDEAIERGHYAGLNTCCTKTVTGSKWLNDFLESLPVTYRRMVKPGKTNTEFKLGGEEVSPSYGAYIIPVIIYGKLTKIRVEALTADLPLVIGRLTMEKMGVIINYPHEEVTIFGLTKPMIKSAAGHPIIRVFPNVPKDRVSPHDIKIISVDDERYRCCSHSQTFPDQVTRSAKFCHCFIPLVLFRTACVPY